MGEARELFEKLADDLHSRAKNIEAGSDSGPESARREAAIMAMVMRAVAASICRTLATQPDPVPELPPYVTTFFADNVFRIEFANGEAEFIDVDCDPDDLIRISEAARILAARERARRAKS